MENVSAEEADISLMSWWKPKQSSKEKEQCKFRGDRSYVYVQCRRDIGDNHDIKK